MTQLTLNLGCRHTKPIIPSQGLKGKSGQTLPFYAVNLKLFFSISKWSYKTVYCEISILWCKTLEFSAKTFQPHPLIKYAKFRFSWLFHEYLVVILFLRWIILHVQLPVPKKDLKVHSKEYLPYALICLGLWKQVYWIQNLALKLMHVCWREALKKS